MPRPWKHVAVLAAIGLGLIAGSAVARPSPTAECIWWALPLATRDRAYVAYEDRGMDAAGSVPSSSVMAAYDSCAEPLETPRNAQAVGAYAGKLMAFATVEYSSRAYLSSRGYSGAVLDGAWERLGPRQRVTLREGLPGMEDGSVDGAEVAKAVANATKILGWTAARKPAVKLSHFTNYFVMRAAREALEERGVEGFADQPDDRRFNPDPREERRGF